MNHHQSQLSIAVMQVAALAEPRFEVKYQKFVTLWIHHGQHDALVQFTYSHDEETKIRSVLY
jgi:hypothetical protein